MYQKVAHGRRYFVLCCWRKLHLLPLSFIIIFPFEENTNKIKSFEKVKVKYALNFVRV